MQIEARAAKANLGALNALSLGNLASQITAVVTSIKGLVATGGALGLAGLASAITNVNASFEMLRKKLEFVIGDTQKAEEVFRRLRQASVEAATPVEKLMNAYVRLTFAGLKPTIEEVKNFAKVAQSLGTSTQAFELATMALTQMAAKGKIMMEELNQQLSEHLPGILRKVAEAMGMSMEEFYQAIEQGKISVQEFYKTFMQVMSDMAKRINLSNTFTVIKLQFINTLKELAYLLGQIGIFDAIKKALKALTQFIERNKQAIVVYGRQVFLALSVVYDILQPVIAAAIKGVQAIGAVFSTLVSLSITVVNGLRMIYYAATGNWQAIMELDQQVKEAWRNTKLLWEQLLELDDKKVDVEVDAKVQEAKKKVEQLQKEISEMKDAEIDISLDVPEEEITGLIEDIEKANPKLTLDIDTSLADQKLDMWLDEWQRRNELEFNVNTICGGDYTPSWDRC